MAEQGICHICAQSKECLVSNFGWICRECFHKLAMDRKSDSGVVVLPEDPNKTTFVLMEGSGYGTFITVEGYLYCYENKEVAEYALAKLAKVADATGIYIRELPIVEPMIYALKTPGIRFLGIKDFKERLAAK